MLQALHVFIFLFVGTALGHADARVDWERGFVIADAIGVADRHAPTPAVARGTSRRGAEDNARKQISAFVGSMPLATGGTFGDRALPPAVTLDAEPETDGAWRVTLGVPIEGLRIAVDGRRAWKADAGPPVVVVTVPKSITVTPAIGWRIANQKVATLFPGRIPKWVGKDVPVVKATAAAGGNITCDNPGNAATLYIVVME